MARAPTRLWLEITSREITAFRLWIFTSNIGDATLFFACWLLAMLRRHAPVVHARYMVGTGVTFIPPIFDRLVSRYAMTPWLAAIMPAVGTLIGCGEVAERLKAAVC